MRFRDHVGDLVHGASDEVHELEFGDWAHAGEGRAEGSADDCGFGDGRVDDALGTEAVDESVGDFEGATVDADVFAEAEDRRVMFHFFPDSLADGFEVSKLHGVGATSQVSKFQGFKASKTKHNNSSPRISRIYADQLISNALRLRFLCRMRCSFLLLVCRTLV